MVLQTFLPYLTYFAPYVIACDLRYGGGRGKVGKAKSNGTKTSYRSDPEDTLNESRSSGAALDTEFLYCCMLCGESYGCQEDLKRHKELVHQQPNCDNETADETGMDSPLDTTSFFTSREAAWS